MPLGLKSLKKLDVKGKKVLCRVDLNVPISHGKVEDNTRITRLTPTIEYLASKGAKVVLLSHLGRPGGEFKREQSLAPLVDPLSQALGGKEIRFAVDCVGHSAEEVIETLQNGEIALLENLRFHKGEESNNSKFVEQLASLGDIYVNDSFSCSHRKHASIVGLSKALPAAAGLLLNEEIQHLNDILEQPKPPFAAIVGGAKVSTKISLLENLITKVDVLVIGGAMANTFLKAKGHEVGISLYEEKLVSIAKTILEKAAKSDCEVCLPIDVITAKALVRKTTCHVVSIDNVPKDEMILDIGPDTVQDIVEKLTACKTIVWNGPLGAFETSPFDVGTISLARNISKLNGSSGITTVAGGGDIIAALKQAGLAESFTYLSTAGGAFLEWLEGKTLPGIEVLLD